MGNRDVKDQGNGRCILLVVALRRASGRVRLKVEERVEDIRRKWILEMQDGQDMLEFLRDYTRLVDGCMLLNCEVDGVAGFEGGIEVLIAWDAKERDDA